MTRRLYHLFIIWIIIFFRIQLWRIIAIIPTFIIIFLFCIWWCSFFILFCITFILHQCHHRRITFITESQLLRHNNHCFIKVITSSLSSLLQHSHHYIMNITVIIVITTVHHRYHCITVITVSSPLLHTKNLRIGIQPTKRSPMCTK